MTVRLYDEFDMSLIDEVLDVSHIEVSGDILRCSFEGKPNSDFVVNLFNVPETWRIDIN